MSFIGIDGRSLKTTPSENKLGGRAKLNNEREEIIRLIR
jgi:hypothetical protein